MAGHAEDRFVYFLESPDMHLIKIGVCNHVGPRLAQIRGGSPLPLTLLGVVPCKNYGALEKQLHREFAEFRVRGEWFRDALPIRDYIAEWADEDHPGPKYDPLLADQVINTLSLYEDDPPMIRGIKRAFFQAVSPARGPDAKSVAKAIDQLKADPDSGFEDLVDEGVIHDTIMAKARTFRPPEGWPRRGF